MIMISLLVPRGRHADDGGLGDEEEEDDERGEAHEESGESEAQSPVRVDEVAGEQGAEDVAEAGVGVPEAHDEAAPPLPEPVGHDRHHAWPASGLEDAGEHL